MSKIIFSKHALRKIRERGVHENEVINTVEEPVEVIDVKYGRRAGFKL